MKKKKNKKKKKLENKEWKDKRKENMGTTRIIKGITRNTQTNTQHQRWIHHSSILTLKKNTR